MNRKERLVIQEALADARAVREYVRQRRQSDANIRAAKLAQRLQELIDNEVDRVRRRGVVRIRPPAEGAP
jgi:hypothetical protein